MSITLRNSQFFNKKAQLHIEIQLVALKFTSWKSMGGKKTKKIPKSYDVGVKQTCFWTNQG
jgi:hypothetical protein